MTPDTRTDARLLRDSRHDADAFALFYERHVDEIMRWLSKQVNDRDVALELAAETFAQALQSTGRYRAPHDESALPRLYGIARHLVGRFARDQRIQREARERLRILADTTFVDEDQERAIGALDHTGDRSEAVGAAIRGLPDEQRSAIELRVLHELPYQEIAERLGCTTGAARTRVSRGLAILQTRLERGSTP